MKKTKILIYKNYFTWYTQKMIVKTYETLSDEFDKTIRENNYSNITKINAETFWDYKHNYIVDKLSSNENNINIEKELKAEEEFLAKRKEQLRKIPFKAIEKISNLNYWDISKNESDVISYLQENTNNNTPTEILNFIYRLEQYFDYLLKEYKNLWKWIINDLDKEIEYKIHPEIKECEYEAKEWSIKKGLRTLWNVIVNEAISYDLNAISEISWIWKDELKSFMTNENKAIEDEELLKKLHRFIYRMKYKYNEYCSRFTRIAEWKEYEEAELWIKDLSEIELPEEEKSTIERKVHKIQIEDIDRENKPTKDKVEKKKIENTDEGQEKKWRLQKVKNRFK